jgi:hypothetical protein
MRIKCHDNLQASSWSDPGACHMVELHVRQARTLTVHWLCQMLSQATRHSTLQVLGCLADLQHELKRLGVTSTMLLSCHSAAL